MSPTSASTDLFDRLAFRKYVKNIGRPYRKRAVELISISRTFAHAVKEERFRTYDDDLRSVLQAVDDALHSAIEARKKTLKDVDENFKKAIDALSAYEKTHHPVDLNGKPPVAERMKTAEEMDISSLKFLNKLKENWLPMEKKPMMIVEFILHKTLLDRSPTIVKQELSQNSNVKEILWNFSRYRTDKEPDKKKRLTLRQHPHFYKKLPERYEGRFRADPTETFGHDQISVLVDNEGQTGRVYLEIPSKRKRVFSNVWDARDAIIFKDIFGKLEGESIVGSVMRNTPNLWCFEEPPRSLSHTSVTSQQSLSTGSDSTTLNSSPSTMPPTPTTSLTGELVDDWKEPIRRLTRLSDINIRISPISSTDFKSSHDRSLSHEPALPFPTPVFDSNPIAGNLPIVFPQPRLPIKVQIPKTPTRSPTPSAPSPDETTPVKPLSPQPPVVAEPSPRSLTPPSPETPPVLPPSHLTPPQTPCITVPLPTPPPLPRPLLPPALPCSPPTPSFPSPVPPPPPLSPPGPVITTPTRYPLHGNSDPEDEYLSEEDLSEDASTVTPTSGSQPRKRKKRKWYQRVIDRVLRRGPSQQADAS